VEFEQNSHTHAQFFLLTRDATAMQRRACNMWRYFHVLSPVADKHTHIERGWTSFWGDRRAKGLVVVSVAAYSQEINQTPWPRIIRGEKWFGFTPAAPTKIRSLIAEPDFNPPGQSNDVNNPSIARPLFIQPLKPDAHFNFYEGSATFFRRFINWSLIFRIQPLRKSMRNANALSDCAVPQPGKPFPIRRVTTTKTPPVCPPISIFDAHIGTEGCKSRKKLPPTTFFDGKTFN
jgi:hypothetical protein